MSYSPLLQYFADRLEGLSTSVFRLESANQTSNITPQSIIRFTLPSNALVHLHKFTFHFNIQTNAGLLTVSNRLPNGLDHIINRVDCQIGGVSLASGTNFYNVLKKTKEIVDGSYDDAGLTHPEIIPGTDIDNYVDGQALTVSEAPDATGNRAQFAISDWCGFLGECQPAVLDTSLFGDLVVTIYLEQSSLCLTQSDGNTTNALFTTAAVLGSSPAPSYTLNNIYATVPCYSMASGVYDNLVAEQMSSTGELEIPFKQYFSFRDTNTGSTRFTVASQSMNRILVAHHQNVAPSGTTGCPISVVGYNQIAGTDASRTLQFGKMKYIHPYTNFSIPTAASAGTPLQFEYILNGARFPMYRMLAPDVLQVLRDACYGKKYKNLAMGLHQYENNYFVSAINLTLDAPNARYIQGLDTRSVSLQGYYNIFNMSGSKVVTLFAECTSSLIVGSGRQIAVVN